MTKRNQKTVILTIRITEKQAETLNILSDFGVNISQFTRLAIKEKISRDWKGIKAEKEIVKYHFKN